MAGVFAGVRVIELAQYVFVPGAGVLLADQGAEVIKIELTGTGDPYRTLKVGDGREKGAVNLAMEQNNRNKKSVALDLKSEEGREALLKLIETADVFLTSLRPKAIRALKLTYEDLLKRNPKIIYARGNGLGFKGDEADKPGFDSSSFWARGGVCYAFTKPGAQPTSPRPAFGDHSGSMALAFGIAGALLRRTKTGEPALVDTSLLSTAVWMLSGDVTYSQMPGYQVHGAQAINTPLKYSYRTKDDEVIQIMLLDPRLTWPTLCKLLKIDHLISDPRFADNELRMENADELISIIQEIVGSRTWEEWRPEFDAWDAPWELIRKLENVAYDPQVIANEMVFHMDVGAENIRVVAGPTSFDGSAAPAVANASPSLGQQTDELLREVGYSADAIKDLRARNLAQ